LRRWPRWWPEPSFLSGELNGPRFGITIKPVTLRKKKIVNGIGRTEQSGRHFWERFFKGLLLIPLLLTGCEEVDLTLPTADEVESVFIYDGSLSATLNGNVAEVTIVQAERQLRRGGALWAKVGPYVFLFSKESESLFRDYPGLAGIRVVTVTPGGTEVARAMLLRDELNDVTWRRAQHIAGLARRDGTRRPTLLEALVEWGEDHTEFDYAKIRLR